MKKRTKFTIFLFIVGLICLGALGLYSSQLTKINEKQDNIYKEWTTLSEYYRRRSDITPQLMNLLHSVRDSQIKKECDELNNLWKVAKADCESYKKHYLNEDTFTGHKAAQDAFEEQLNKVFSAANNYSVIKNSPEYSKLEKEFRTLAENIKDKREDFNKRVQIYNDTIAAFPEMITAKINGNTPLFFY
ncbi:MAG: LemA family protein [Treponema sp.]|nr:LemA family protein [Treponema sp.]